MTKEDDERPGLEKAKTRDGTTPSLMEGLDYYIEGGFMVFTAHFLLSRGYCCDSGCRHCPYEKGQHRLL